MQTELKPLHQIKELDQIAYYQSELQDPPPNGYREGLYSATVVEKVHYTLRLSVGLLKPCAMYRVVVPAEPEIKVWKPASRSKPDMVKSAGRDIPIS